MKPILTDFIIIDGIFKDFFLINLADNSHIWRAIFEIKKKILRKKLKDFEKTRSRSDSADSLKSVKKAWSTSL